jgi:hypothetical protein
MAGNEEVVPFKSRYWEFRLFFYALEDYAERLTLKPFENLQPEPVNDHEAAERSACLETDTYKGVPSYYFGSATSDFEA